MLRRRFLFVFIMPRAIAKTVMDVQDTEVVHHTDRVADTDCNLKLWRDGAAAGLDVKAVTTSSGQVYWLLSHG